MKRFPLLILVNMVALLASCAANQSKPNSPNSSGASGGTCSVSFTLTYTNKPAANTNVAIFQLAGDTVKTSKEYQLGSGTTDSTGKANISFSCPASATYVVMEVIKPEVMMSLRNNDGSFLSFNCGGDKKTCNAGILNAVAFGH